MPSKKKTKTPPPAPAYPQLTKHPAMEMLMRRVAALESVISGLDSDLRQARCDIANLSAELNRHERGVEA